MLPLERLKLKFECIHYYIYIECDHSFDNSKLISEGNEKDLSFSFQAI